MQVVGNKVIVQKITDKERTTEAGVILAPGVALNTARGVVLDCPMQYTDNGVLRTTPFKVGDTIVYTPKSAFKLDTASDHYIFSMENVLYVE